MPWGTEGYSSGTARAVLDNAQPGARLVFSCGWHISRDGLDVYSGAFKAMLGIAGRLMRLFRVALTAASAPASTTPIMSIR